MDAGLTLKELAGQTGLSSPFLSRIERGLTMPSIPTLQAAADALKVDIEFFFRSEGERDYVVSPGAGRRTVVSAMGSRERPAYLLELLAPGLDNSYMEPALVTLLGREEEVPTTTHEGQEFLYVVEGRIRLTLGSKTFVLKRGDAAYWNGRVPHKGVSLGKKPARTLNVHLVPGQRSSSFVVK